MSPSTSRRRTARARRAWMLALLGLLLCLVPVAITVNDLATPETLPVVPPEAAEAHAPGETPRAAEIAPAPAPRPARPHPRPVEGLIKLPPIVEKAPRRPHANENAAVATSRNVMSAQAMMQASAHIDEDRDGTGEFATFAEMSGAVAVRGGSGPIRPTVLSSAFRKIDANGRVTRSGYVYAIYLPRAGGWGCLEQGHGGLATGLVDPDLAETTWCVYAWPLEYGKTGKRTFMANQVGDVVATDCPSYSGANGPNCDAAFVPDPTLASGITGRVAIGARGNDGNLWKQVN